jgi:hypothetical protein
MPRTKEKYYKTLTSRIPQELVDQVERYAEAHRVTVGAMILRGLEWAVAQADIAPRPRYTTPAPEAHPVQTRLDAMNNMNNMSDIYAPDMSALDGASVVREAPPAAPELEAPPAATLVAATVRAFDNAKNFLGALCPRKHDYHGTGKSLRRLKDHYCLQCDAEKARAARAARKQQQKEKA